MQCMNVARLAFLSVLLLPVMSHAAPYSAQRSSVENTEVLRLTDAERQIEVLIAPSIGNNAYSMKVRGHEIFWSPYKTLAEWKAKPTLLGNPFLAPWANRIDGESYYANGRKYTLNPDLKNYRRDGHGQPIHGLVSYTDRWQVTRLHADDKGAEATSRLEFWRSPDWMAQFPFAHTIEMTYRLRDGALEVETAVQNHATEPMPLSLGYHPYFQLNDAPRDQWKVALPAKQRVVLSRQLTPTGDREPNPYARPLALAGVSLDDVFSTLEPGGNDRTTFTVEGKSQRIAVEYGPRYPVAVVYSPQDRGFICFEPMTGVTNAFNLAHQGKEPNLQRIAPGETWRESFWIRPSGF